MKCPHCQYTSSDTALLKCSHCGNTFERGPLEELQHIDYLQAWLNAHELQLGTAVANMQTEIQAQRNSLEDRLGLRKVDLEKASRELALLQGTYERMPRWAKAANLDSSSLDYIQHDLMGRIEEQRNLALGLKILKVVPEELEILDYALETLTEEEGAASFGYYLLRAQILAERDSMLTDLSRDLALEQAVIKFIPVWEKQSGLEIDFSTKLTGLLCSKAERTLTLLAGRQVLVKPLAELEVTEYAIQATPGWAANLGHTTDYGEVQKLLKTLYAERESLKQPVTLAQAASTAQAAAQPPVTQVAAQPPAALPPMVPAPRRPAPPAKPAKPPRPPIDWGKIWEKTVQAAVSGALLRGLLYLGAFMIVVSLTILVVRFWDIFPSILQAVFIFSVPTAFYLAGWIIRDRLKLPQAGTALTGVGALLVAVDLAAVYQFGGLSVALELYWLVGGLVCTVIYGLTAWRLQGIFFDYIALIGGLNVLVALTRFLNLPLEWSIVAVMIGNGLMVFTTTRLWGSGDSWRDTARATRYLPQVLIPPGLLAVLFVPGNPAAGQAVTFLFASLSYGMLAWRFPGAIFTYATVGCSVGAAGFSLVALTLPFVWFGAATALLAMPYTLAAGWMGRRIPPDIPARHQILLAPNLAGFVLLLAAMWIGFATLFVDYWAGVTALGLAALVLAFWSYWFRRPWLVFMAAGLFCAPFSLALGRLLLDARVDQWFDWLMTAIAGLALAYLGIAILLRRVDKYAAALHLWVQILPPAIGWGLLMSYSFHSGDWDNFPALTALAVVMLIYLSTAILHDGGKHRGLSSYVSRLFPGSFGQAVFIWVLALVFPVWIGIAWYGSVLSTEWLGTALIGLGLVYLGAGQFLMQRKRAYQTPWHATALILAAVGVWLALGDDYALVTGLYLDVVLLAGMAAIHHSRLAIAAASVLFILPFQITLDLLFILPHAQSVAYALLVCFGYLPLGIGLDRFNRKFAMPIYVVGYSLSVFALLASIMGRLGAYSSNLPWVGVLTPVVITGIYIYSLYHFRWTVFAWAVPLALVIVFGQSLTLLRVPPVYDAAAWAGLAYLYLFASWGFTRSRYAWLRLLPVPLGVGSAVLGFSSLALTMGLTRVAFFSNYTAAQQPPILLAQVMVAGLGILASVLFRSRWPLYLVPWLAFLPVTLFFIGYGELLFGVPLTTAQFGLVWSCLGMINLIAAAVLDPLQERYAHGLYLGGYALALLSIFWSIESPSVLVWTFGFWIVICTASSFNVHIQRHKTWDEIVMLLFGQSNSNLRQVVHDAFLWLAAWLFPLWCILLLIQLDLLAGYQWLGFSLPALAYLGIGIALARLQRLYAWPFITAGQLYTALALLVSTPATLFLLEGYGVTTADDQLTALAFILAQACAVAYYTLCAAIYHRRLFAYLASFLVFLPYTLAWIAYSNLSSAKFSLPWMGLATLLLVVGYLLDRRPERYSHGPYLAGYLLAVFALAWSIPDRAASLYVLAWNILLAAASQLLVHYRRHTSYADLVGWLLRSQPTASVTYRAAQTLFLFFAVYAFPVWLTLLLSYHQVPLAWRGLALALVAPLYIAAGLALHRVREEYTWPLYSAGYALTAIGAMVSFDNLTLAAYVLALDAVVYAASAYIFRQAFWLYLSNFLVPVVALLALYINDMLVDPWVAGIYIGLAYLYFAFGLWFDRRATRQVDIQAGARKHFTSYALPFYFPAYLLSIVSLAVAISERNLAIAVYLLGVAFYALSAWVFQRSLFLYPAAWLAVVPYYLAMTLTPLPVQWYGLGWLPLILAYILLGRFAFHKKPLDLLRASSRAHPAIPFYLLAYALSVSMILLSAGEPLILTLALVAGALIYFGSAALFRQPAWLYPGLLAAQLAVLSCFTVQPIPIPSYYLSLPFLVVTWITALVGYAFTRLKPPDRQAADGKRLFKLWKWEVDFSDLPSIGHLLTPSWAQPFFIFTMVDILAWQIVALFSFETAIVVALGYAILLSLFAMLWRDEGLAYGALAFGLLVAVARLSWAQATLAEMLAWLGGIGFAIYLVGRLVEAIIKLRQPKTSRLEVWSRPLFDLPVGLTALAVIGTLPFIASETIATAAALAFGGALYLAIAYRGRYFKLGYLAVGMLEAAWVLALIVREVQQPQLYAIPAGLYFTLMGYLESRRGHRLYSQILESFGLAILLVTSFIQSLNGAQGFPYFVLLLVEGVLVMWWGAARRQKIPFFAGLGASVLNVVAQVVVLVSVYEVNRWFIILGVGLLLVVLAVFVERRRERLLIQAQTWRDALESWS